MAISSNRYSVATGNWNSTSTWSATSGGSSGATIPVSGDVVFIEGNYTVTLNANTANTLNSITIATGSTFTTTNNFTVNATTITVNGVYNNGSTGAITVTTMRVNNGATYQHDVNSATIPSATWGASSNCLITGIVSTKPPIDQNFGNLTWNCPDQTAEFGANGSGTINIQGNLTIVNTGTKFFHPKDNVTHTIGGDFIQTGGTLQFMANPANPTMVINGNFSKSAGLFWTKNEDATVQIAGDFSFTGGTIQGVSASKGFNFIFNGSDIQTFTSGGTFVNIVNWVVNSGSTFQTKDVNTVIGGTTFTVSSDATLGVSSSVGISQTGYFGNIQTTGTRSFATDANYIYNGTTAQITGSGLSQVKNLSINNPMGVTLSTNIKVNGILTLTTGIVKTSATTLLTIGNSGSSANTGSNSSYVDGPMHKIGNTSFVFPIGKGGINAPFGFTPFSGFDVTTEMSSEYFNIAAPTGNHGSGIHNVSEIEYWDINRYSDVGNNAQCNVTMYFNDLTRSGIAGDGSDLRAAHLIAGTWTDFGGTFVKLGNTGQLSSINPLTSYSEEAPSSGNGYSSLPIELDDFKAKVRRK